MVDQDDRQLPRRMGSPSVAHAHGTFHQPLLVTFKFINGQDVTVARDQTAIGDVLSSDNTCAGNDVEIHSIMTVRQHGS